MRQRAKYWRDRSLESCRVERRVMPTLYARLMFILWTMDLSSMIVDFCQFIQSQSLPWAREQSIWKGWRTTWYCTVNKGVKGRERFAQFCSCETTRNMHALNVSFAIWDCIALLVMSFYWYDPSLLMADCWWLDVAIIVNAVTQLSFCQPFHLMSQNASGLC